ncbi:hypothetical protein CZ787_13170 [Halomonas citrativorans]|uniref:Uncharacterized protein n=1 Tax=Halomonas citrativorans TaxID=2742612 RepID=A0A1R4I374_9GAMM|nr:hypothetical protein CZ787_13170 [Halomonas citrativorans]
MVIAKNVYRCVLSVENLEKTSGFQASPINTGFALVTY